VKDVVRTRQSKPIAVVVAGIVACVSLLIFPSPFVSPAFAQATQPSNDVRQWFAQLADTDPNVREQARFNLLGLRRDQLGLLRQIVIDSRPLAPAQSAALHDIVLHIYLSAEPYLKNERSGFMGAILFEVRQPAFFLPNEGLMPDVDPQQATADESPVRGVLIQECVPGFCAFRYLQPGDLVLGVVGQILLLPTQSRDELRDQVLAHPPGGIITLKVLRRGRVVRVAFPLDSAPRAAEAGLISTQQFQNTRREKGESYWQFAFAPLIDASLS